MKKLAILLLVLIGCSSDSSGPPTQVSVAGTWNLKSVNGANLPFVLAQTGQNKLELTSDVLVVSSGGSFTQTTTLRQTLNGQVTTQSVADAGRYTLNGTAVTFVFNSDGSSGTGTISGNTFTLGSEGFSYIYQKQ